jgi:hypothetical protein
MHHRIQTEGSDGTLDSGFETWTVAYATPTGPGRSRLLARFPFKFPAPKRGPNIPKLIMGKVPDWLNHMNQLKVLDDDNIFLPLQERRIADVGGWKGNYVMPTAADTYVTAYRRWFDLAGAPPHAAASADAYRRMLDGAAPDKASLLNRQAQHTDHCTSCSGALKNAKRAQMVCRSLLLGMLALSPSLLLAAAGQPSWRLRATALRPFAALALAALPVLKANNFARSVERALTSGMWLYPPPRNLSSGRGANKNLKTVEQGRNN